MRDYKFGTFLYNLRKDMELSQEEVGKLVGVSNKAVSKWETGASKPAIKQLYSLSKIYNVSMEQLLEYGNVESPDLTKIVITGGPCAGKSTALSSIYDEFTKKGYTVIIVPESATELILSGISMKTLNSQINFQQAAIQNQLNKETLFTETAKKLKDASKILLVCDRGLLDGKAYVSDLEFRQLLKILGKNEIELRDNYDAVFHLVTAAKGAEEFYTKTNNLARLETIEEARIADDKTLAAWAGHPHLRVIDNSVNFADKIKNLNKEISAFLGEPEPHEIERKFLIKMPNLTNTNNNTIKKIEIIQTYLTSENPNEELRIRQRGLGKSFVYTKTIKRKISNLERIEIEHQISKDEYLSLLLNADQNRRQIRKTRYCLVHKNQYIEIDIYPFWKDKAIMEIELKDKDEEIKIPDFVEVIKEVTDDKNYKNYNLAKQYN